MIENTVVEFNYQGGSNPGGKRTVFLTEVGRNDFLGYDFKRQALRRFKTNKATNLVTSKTAKVVDISSLPQVVRGMVEKEFQAEGFETYNEFPYVVAVPKPVTKLSLSTSGALTFEGPNGRTVIQTGSGRLSLYENGVGVNFNPDDPKPVYDSIKKVLGY